MSEVLSRADKTVLHAHRIVGNAISEGADEVAIEMRKREYSVSFRNGTTVTETFRANKALRQLLRRTFEKMAGILPGSQRTIQCGHVSGSILVPCEKKTAYFGINFFPTTDGEFIILLRSQAPPSPIALYW